MPRSNIHDVLASRYASKKMAAIWSENAKIIQERKFWIAVLSTQQSLGAAKHVPAEAVRAYKKVTPKVNLGSIRRRELRNKHDVKARIEEFNTLAGYEYIHEGMTSRDLTDNVEQMQVLKSLKLTEMKVVAVLSRLGTRALQFRELPIAGRSHNVPGQVTTVGKRFASFAEELLQGHGQLVHVLQNYPLRGIKGPMGTSQDMLDLLGSSANVRTLEQQVATRLGFEKCFSSVGQIYPRSLDRAVISALVQIAAAGSTFATTLRLMAGAELAAEGFKEGQTGSSAMPHKMNARSCERMCGFYQVLRGFNTMIEGVAGGQWNEGDVSCSVVRRVALPDSFFTIDGLLDTWMTILDQLGIYESMVTRELERNLPFLASTKLLMAALQAGLRREEAHKTIKMHATKAVDDLRTTGNQTFFADLGKDSAFPLDEAQIMQLIGTPMSFAGLATQQVDEVLTKANAICAHRKDAHIYSPEPIL